jgi:hypothetical protein
VGKALGKVWEGPVEGEGSWGGSERSCGIWEGYGKGSVEGWGGSVECGKAM